MWQSKCLKNEDAVDVVDDGVCGGDMSLEWRKYVYTDICDKYERDCIHTKAPQNSEMKLYSRTPL